ncbi:hypothetical protein FA95DRAFT_1392279 [Auriscalpium vulgare]|uniref:Uncharacterized protein n=1 Tax=Auriscalpium vulgare TaxID=40419 RepID=A0ACB8S788_9AGAM|nr:hypothetical protein FA95DRAFT_1392279 [Auriscalpium vulgare]
MGKTAWSVRECSIYAGGTYPTLTLLRDRFGPRAGQCLRNDQRPLSVVPCGNQEGFAFFALLALYAASTSYPELLESASVLASDSGNWERPGGGEDGMVVVRGQERTTRQSGVSP